MRLGVVTGSLARMHPPSPTRARGRHSRALALMAGAVLAVAACGGGSGQEATARDGPPATASTTASTTTTAPPRTTNPPAPPTTTTAPPPPTTPPTTVPPTTAPPTTLPPPPPPPPTPDRTVCVGDSVMLGAGPQYQNALPMCGTVDAAESRQFASAPEILAQHLGSSPEGVVLALGTNGPVSPDLADAVLSSLSGVRRVLVVNVQLNGGRPWEGQVNDVLRAAVDRFPNATLVDWKAVSDGHPEYFAGDGIHMAAAGALVYGYIIAASF